MLPGTQVARRGAPPSGQLEETPSDHDRHRSPQVVAHRRRARSDRMRRWRVARGRDQDHPRAAAAVGGVLARPDLGRRGCHGSRAPPGPATRRERRDGARRAGDARRPCSSAGPRPRTQDRRHRCRQRRPGGPEPARPAPRRSRGPQHGAAAPVRPPRRADRGAPQGGQPAPPPPARPAARWRPDRALDRGGRAAAQPDPAPRPRSTSSARRWLGRWWPT